MSKFKKLKALVLGQGLDLVMALPFLLNRAGFEVDLISNHPLMKKSKFVKNIDILEQSNFVENLSKRDLEQYDFIVPCDDETLELILNSNLSVEKKLKLLPVTSIKGFEHIFSKIGLSKTLSQAGISTPEFLVADGIDEAKKAAEIMGYPVMIKINSSNGGRGVFECRDIFDFENVKADFFNKPVLVQKKITGIELDLSAIYRDKKLIFFSHSQIQKVVSNKFGPSVVRLYTQLGTLDKKLFLEMEKLGEALNANGFVTISVIETAEKKRYFIECDMRPNSWVDFSKFFGDDPAIKISNWFLKNTTLSYPAKVNKNYPTEIVLPYFGRMSRKEILLNRYKVWKYLPYQDGKLLFWLLYENFLIHKIHPKILYKKTKRLPLTIVRMVVSKKADRARIRNKIRQLFFRYVPST